MSRGRSQVGDLLRAARVLNMRDPDGLARLAAAMGLTPAHAPPAGAAAADGRDGPPGDRRDPARPRDGRAPARPVRTVQAALGALAVAAPAAPAPETSLRPDARDEGSPGSATADASGPSGRSARPVTGPDTAGVTGGSLLMLRAPLPPVGAPGQGDPPALPERGVPAEEGPPEIFDVPWTTAPPRPDPPWNPRSERAAFLAVASTHQTGHTVDHTLLMEMVVRSLAGGPTARPRVPYRRRATTRAGVHLLLDRGESMRPFRDDQAWLASLAARVLPPDRLTVLDFRIRRGASGDGGRTWEPHPVPPHGRPVLLVSDLGHLQPPLPGRHHASPADWGPYLRRLRGAGNPVTCLTPYPAEEYPAAVRQAVTLLTLDHGGPVRTARSGPRGHRRRTGRGS
jgi:hypothetical protein